MQIHTSASTPNTSHVLRMGGSSALIESSAGPLTQDDLDMLHNVYGDFEWPKGSEGRPVPAIAFDIADARNLQRAQGLQANLQSTAVEVILAKHLDSEHYDTDDLAKCLQYLKANGANIGINGEEWINSKHAPLNSIPQYQDPNGTYL